MAWNSSHNTAVNHYKTVKPGKHCVLQPPLFRFKATGHMFLIIRQNPWDNMPRSHTVKFSQSMLNILFGNMWPFGAYLMQHIAIQHRDSNTWFQMTHLSYCIWLEWCGLQCICTTCWRNSLGKLELQNESNFYHSKTASSVACGDGNQQAIACYCECGRM